MKQVKRPKQTAVVGHMVSTHLPSGKNKVLANALLRVSERAANQDRTKKDDVIYCGEEEPFHGWTNAIPYARYSATTRPKQVKKRKLSKKIKSDFSNFDNNRFPNKNNGLSTQDIEQVHSYSTLRDMYDSYKKTMEREKHEEKNGIVDPETFAYIPWNQRKTEEEESEDFRLPKMKMNRSKKPSKLMEVLQKYVSANKESTEYFNASSEDAGSSLMATDMLDYIDKNNENQTSFGQNGKQTKRRNLHVHLPSLTSHRHAEENLQPHVKEKLIRYVNGAVHNKRNHKEIFKDDRNAPEAGMVKLERKRELNKNSHPSDHWVARVIIKEPDKTGSNRLVQYDGSESSSSVIIVPDARWKRKLGVVEAERERIQKEMDKLHFQQQQQLKLNQLRKRLLHNSYEVDDKASYRMKRKHVQSHAVPSHYSLVETAKVSVKYNVETSRKKGIVREISVDEMTIPYLARLGIPPIKPHFEKKSTENATNRRLTIDENHVTKIVPPGSKKPSTKTKHKDGEQSKSGRLFLNRGAARKGENRKTSLKNNKIKLPVLPKQAKLEKPDQSKPAKNEEHASNNGNSIDEQQLSDDVSCGKDDVTSLPEIQGASAHFKAALTDNADHPKSPSSTFNSNEMMKQVMDTAQFIGRTPQKNAEFIRYQVIQQPGQKSSAGQTERRPLHPPHSKNRAQEKIQGLVDQEKGVLDSAIDHLSSNGASSIKPRASVPGELGHPDTFKAALSSAIAHARMFEESKSHAQVPPNLTNGNRNGNAVVMKRRVVPPILSSSVLPAPQDASQSEPPLALNTTDEATSIDDVKATSQKKERKTTKRKRVLAQKRSQERDLRKKLNDDRDRTFDDVILSGDVIVRQRPTPQLLEHSFAASITSVKPSRRIVNVLPQRVVQKG